MRRPLTRRRLTAMQALQTAFANNIEAHVGRAIVHVGLVPSPSISGTEAQIRQDSSVLSHSRTTATKPRGLAPTTQNRHQAPKTHFSRQGDTSAAQDETILFADRAHPENPVSARQKAFNSFIGSVGSDSVGQMVKLN